jgi:hypothetical protein
MKNVTISMDDELAQRVRVAAAHAGQSVSRYLAEAGQRRIEQDERPKLDEALRERQREALKQLLDAPKIPISEDGRMPTADERNARR